MIPPTDDQIVQWLIESGVADPDLSDPSEGFACTDYGSVSDETIAALREFIMNWALGER